MALSNKEEKRVSSRIFSCLSFVVAVALLVVGVACWKSGSGVVSMINKGLVEEKIYFPPADNPAFDAAVFPDAQKYAGKQVDDGTKAKVYAEDFVGVQMDLVGGGKTSSEVAALVAADPQNAGLQQQQSMMFQLGTTKAILLANGYGAWSQGMMIKNVGMALVGSGLLLLLVSGAQYMRYKRL